MAHWKQRETVFGEYELALTLPGRWQLRPSDSPERWLYRSSDQHKEHLTISREEPGGVAGAEAATLRKCVARQRKALELGFGRVSDLTMSEPEYGEQFGVPCVTYQGDTPSGGHQFRVLMICPPRTVWTLVYDAFRMTPEQAEASAAAIFESVLLRPFR